MELDEETLTHIAFNMEFEYREKGSLICNSDTFTRDKGVDEMIIIFDGVASASIKVDKKIPIVLDYLSKGDIFRSNHFLSLHRH